MKAGTIPAQQEPIKSGFRWLVEIDDAQAGALAEGAGAAPQAGAQSSSATIEELAKLRAERDGLERLLSEIAAERDDWKERHAQEQRASAEARRIAETAQRIAEAAQQEAAQARQLAAGPPAEPSPAGASEEAQHGPQRPGTIPEASAGTDNAQRPTESFSARVRRWFMGGSS